MLIYKYLNLIYFRKKESRFATICKKCKNIIAHILTTPCCLIRQQIKRDASYPFVVQFFSMLSQNSVIFWLTKNIIRAHFNTFPSWLFKQLKLVGFYLPFYRKNFHYCSLSRWNSFPVCSGAQVMSQLRRHFSFWGPDLTECQARPCTSLHRSQRCPGRPLLSDSCRKPIPAWHLRAGIKTLIFITFCFMSWTAIIIQNYISRSINWFALLPENRKKAYSEMPYLSRQADRMI